MKRGVVKCLYDQAKRLVTKPSVISEEKKHLSSVLVFNGYPYFVQKITRTRTAPRREPVAEVKSTAVLPYIQGVLEPLRCCPEQGIRTVFKSDTTLRSYLVRPKDTVDPPKKVGVVYKFPCEPAKSTSGKQGGLYRRGSKSTTAIYDSPVPRPPPFLHETRPATIQFGTRLSLLIETLTGTHVGSRKLST